MRLVPRALAAACALALVPAAAASADTGYPNKLVNTYPTASYAGEQHLQFKFGPIHVNPGQNTVSVEPIKADGLPSVPGYITSFTPNLTYLDGTVPGVDVVHLHHGVWLVDGAPEAAVGEEKTIVNLPQGFGEHYDPGQKWTMVHMVHDLLPNPTDVYITYDITFVPDTIPAAATIKPVYTLWLDVAGFRAYPVFDAKTSYGRGAEGRYTFPDMARTAAARRAIGPAHRYVVPHDMTLVYTAGHVHPGGLWTDLDVTRDGRTVRLFRSQAHYYEPAGAVSWDVSMTATKPGWRVQVKQGDVLTVSGTYDTKRASWYEVMAIMPTAVYDGADAGGADPFVTAPDTTGILTHGRLPENSVHGGRRSGLPDARDMLNGRPVEGPIQISNFIYGRGDLNAGGRVPTVKRGRSLTFLNRDDARTIWHTITACRAPCNKTTGIAYPLANGKVDFDSGELGTGPVGFWPVSGKVEWKTPKTLRAGTYTYFCRVHPFMRGAFRVVR
jgi:plastocyanin